MKVTWYVEKIDRIKRAKRKAKTHEIINLWNHIAETPSSERAQKYIKKNILLIYPSLDFEQKHAALQVLIRIHCGSDIRDLIFNYLSDVYQQFGVVANLMSSYLCILEDIDESPRSNIGPWELDKTFAAVHKKLNKS